MNGRAVSPPPIARPLQIDHMDSRESGAREAPGLFYWVVGVDGLSLKVALIETNTLTFDQINRRNHLHSSTRFSSTRFSSTRFSSTRFSSTRFNKVFQQPKTHFSGALRMELHPPEAIASHNGGEGLVVVGDG